MTTKKDKPPHRLPPRRRSMEETHRDVGASAFDKVPAPEKRAESFDGKPLDTRGLPREEVLTKPVEKAVEKPVEKKPIEKPVEPTAQEAELAILMAGLGASVAQLSEVLDAMNEMMDD